MWVWGGSWSDHLHPSFLPPFSSPEEDPESFHFQDDTGHSQGWSPVEVSCILIAKFPLSLCRLGSGAGDIWMFANQLYHWGRYDRALPGALFHTHEQEGCSHFRDSETRHRSVSSGLAKSYRQSQPDSRRSGPCQVS